MIGLKDTRQELKIAQKALEDRIKLEQELKDAMAVVNGLLPGRKSIKKEERRWNSKSKEADVYEERFCCLNRSNMETPYFEVVVRSRFEFGSGWEEHYSLYHEKDKKSKILISTARGQGPDYISISKDFWTLEDL